MFNAEQVSYNAIGTAAAPATLTAAYSGNRKVLFSRLLQNVNILGSYTPGNNNAVLNIQFEMSPDGENWATIPAVENTATVIKVYTEDMSLQIPGDGTSSSGTAIPISYQFTCAAQYIRISAKETTGGASGTAWINVTLANTP